MLAVQNRRPDLVKALLLEGADVDVTDYMGRSPLSMATNIGGSIAIEMMGSLLAAEPSRDDGSLHNAARELNLPAVKVLVDSGHDPDFPSPCHGGRSALGEVCLKGSDLGDMTAEREKSMQKVMNFLIDRVEDMLVIWAHGGFGVAEIGSIMQEFDGGWTISIFVSTRNGQRSNSTKRPSRR